MASDGLQLPRALSAVLILTAVVLTVLGAGLTFANHQMAVLYGAEESTAGTNGSRTAGAAILALGVLAWVGARQPLPFVRAVVLPVLLVWFVLKSVVAYSGLVNGVFRPPVAWTVFVLDMLLALVYAALCFFVR
jgi:hypothetical protein